MSLLRSLLLLSGWRRLLVAFCAGAVGALAMAPFSFLPALMVPMGIGILLLDGVGRSRKDAFAIGWSWGFGYFLAGLWWIGAACLVEADKFAWAVPFAVLGLPFFLAFFPAFGFLLASILWSSSLLRIFSFTFALSVTEMARACLFTGFPWNEWGMALGNHLWIAQIASGIGLHGLTFLAIFLFSLPALALNPAPTPVAHRLLPLAITTCGLAVLISLGLLRLQTPSLPEVPNAHMRIMQPNIQQDSDFVPEKRQEILQKYLALSLSSPDPFTHLFWPESPFPFILSRDAVSRQYVTNALPGQPILITGATRVEIPKPGDVRYYNAIHVVDPQGEIIQTYDKMHRVPFGEYLPLKDILHRWNLTQFVPVPGGYESGHRRVPLQIPGLPSALPLLCYESIFPDEINSVPAVGLRPGFLLNVTDDGWFGGTPGPYQHFAQARLRAIEHGLPLVRAANSGISAFVDPYGRILASLPLQTIGILDHTLPQSLPPTFYAKFPYLFSFGMGMLCFLLGLLGRCRHIRMLHIRNEGSQG